MRTGKVDIIIPVFNQVKFTEACLNSLYRNTLESEFYVTVVDNASDDGTSEFLKQYVKTAPNMNIITNTENLGWCKGLNLGFRHLHKDSEFVLWANNDILFEADWFIKMKDAFSGGIGAVGPISNYVMGRQAAIFNHGQRWEAAQFLIGFCLLFRREVIDIVGDVDERFGVGGSDEMDYILRMKKDTGLQCVIARDVYIHHFGSKTLWGYAGGSSNDYNAFIKDKDDILRDKWGDKPVDVLMSVPQRQILCSVPHTGLIDHKFWMDTLLMSKPDGTEFLEVVKSSAIHDARNVIAEYAVKNNFRYVLFIDSDMRIPQNAIFKLLSHQRPIVAGCFYSRSTPYFPCAFRWDENKQGLISVHSPHSGLVEVDAVGMAFTLISVEVLRSMKNPWFHWKGELSEDMAFCMDARKLGVKIFVDTDLIIPHQTDQKKEIGPEDYVP